MDTKLVLLDRADGWIALVNGGAEIPNRAGVITTAARNGFGVIASGGTLHSALPALERDWIALWAINRQQDSLALFRTFSLPTGSSL